MTKTELVEKIATEAGISKAIAEKALNAFVGTVTETIKSGDKVALIGFGTFSAAKRAARTGRNPKDGKEIQISAKTTGKFTPGKNLKNL